MTKRLLVQGMHGMGDSLHQRAVVRQFLDQGYDVWLETSWPQIYHDLPVHCVKKSVALRTQQKNAALENDRYETPPTSFEKTIRVRYGGGQVLSSASKTVLEAMCMSTGTDYGTADFSFPVPEAWLAEWRKSSAYTLWKESGKPLLVYRPLVSRTEWRGSTARNADPENYARLFALLRDEFFVISVADLVPQREWIVGPVLQADVTFHEGQLAFPALAALFKDADLVYTSSGFAAILGPAVGTPTVNIVGGYEHASAHDSGKQLVAMISIGPEPGCKCWSSTCRQPCTKTFDVDAAISRVRDWAKGLFPEFGPQRRSWQDMHVMQDSDMPTQNLQRRPPATVIGKGPPEVVEADLPVTSSRHPHHALYLAMTRSAARKNAGPRA